MQGVLIVPEQGVFAAEGADRGGKRQPVRCKEEAGQNQYAQASLTSSIFKCKES